MTISLLHFCLKIILSQIFFCSYNKIYQAASKKPFFLFIRYEVVAIYIWYLELFFAVTGYNSFHFAPPMIAEVLCGDMVVVVFPSPQRPYFLRAVFLEILFFPDLKKKVAFFTQEFRNHSTKPFLPFC